MFRNFRAQFLADRQKLIVRQWKQPHKGRQIPEMQLPSRMLSTTPISVKAVVETPLQIETLWKIPVVFDLLIDFLQIAGNLDNSEVPL